MGCYYVAFEQVVNFWVVLFFRGDSAHFSAEVLAPFPFVSGRGNLFSQWPRQCDVVGFQQGSAWVPGWNLGRVLSKDNKDAMKILCHLSKTKKIDMQACMDSIIGRLLRYSLRVVTPPTLAKFTADNDFFEEDCVHYEGNWVHR